MSVLIISGPTSAGKSDLALMLAEKYEAAILSADAMTIYRTLDVGTAKPSVAEQQLVPHYGIDIRNIDEEFSVADFTELFDVVCKNHKRVIVVGGTHFYLSALVEPLSPMPSANPEVREKLSTIDNPHAFLQQVDSSTAERLHPNDTVRIIRALEVFMLTGRPMSVVQKDPPLRQPIDAPIIWLDHEDLRSRLQLRLQKMLQNGYVEECKQILKHGWNRELKPLKSFSYRYMLAHANGELSIDEAIEQTELGTWKLVRKQRTWARNLNWNSITREEAIQKAKLLWG